ncbi:MAG TPA: PDZ domain-containing protein [Chitinophagaceae bacterium]|nr:PDZ domain-containing protein [Chitinophagaceae bacterium]
MLKKLNAATIFILVILSASAQHPFKHWTESIETRYDMHQPVVDYLLTVDSTDFTSFAVEMKISNVADTFHVAMVAHPEYDDRYWKYVEDIFVEAKNGKGKIIREDSSLWKIITNGKEAVLHYRIHLPTVTGIRSSWKAYLTLTGGLVGGPHSFMYVVGATLIPSHVTFNIPKDWEIATGLQSTSDKNVFYASSVAVLIDDPAFIGKFKSWSFSVDNTPHRLIYWSLPNASAFDTIALLLSIEKLAQQAVSLFGRPAYREYSFMLQDGAVGSLEHNNSVTVGAPSSQMANGISGILSETAHEYFHTWNLVRIHPVEYGDVSYKTQFLSKGLWFSEGLTIFYADLLSRRAGLTVFDSTRTFHLENLIRRYSATPAYLKFSAEKISEASYGPVGMLGDYSGSTHLQGEVLGSMLDIMIRDVSNGNKTIDDVMRKMLERFSGEKGFTSKDIEQTVKDVCGCNVQQFFSDHVYGNKQIDFSKYLKLIGLQYTIEWKDVLSNDRKPAPDLRAFLYQLPGENVFRMGLSNPTVAWGRAGLHTGDIVKTVNGKIVANPADFHSLQRNAKIGDTIVVEVQRPSGVQKINVLITGYQQSVIHITQMPALTEKQKRLYEQWASGK